MNDTKIIVALDYHSATEALALADNICPTQCALKVGFGLYTREGPALVRQLVAKKFNVFLDLKFLDIPNTVASACAAAADLGVWMVDVHALGGEAMLTAAREALNPFGKDKPHLIAVTVLTSFNDSALAAVGLQGGAEENVVRLSRLALNAGVDGMVCSAVEAVRLRSEFGPKPLLVTPGIRLLGDKADDQTRIKTPKDALADGASHLVIGRPITKAKDPAAVLAQVLLDTAEKNV